MRTRVAVALGLLAMICILLGLAGWIDAHRPAKTYTHTLECRGPGFTFSFTDVNLLSNDKDSFVLEHPKGTIYGTFGSSVCAYSKKE